MQFKPTLFKSFKVNSIGITTQIRLGAYAHTDTYKDRVCISQLLLCDKETQKSQWCTTKGIYFSWNCGGLGSPIPHGSFWGSVWRISMSSYCNGRSARGKLSHRSLFQVSAHATSTNFPLVKPSIRERKSPFCQA